MRRSNINLMEILEESSKDNQRKAMFKELIAQKCP